MSEAETQAGHRAVALRPAGTGLRLFTAAGLSLALLTGGAGGLWLHVSASPHMDVWRGEILGPTLAIGALAFAAFACWLWRARTLDHLVWRRDRIELVRTRFSSRAVSVPISGIDTLCSTRRLGPAALTIGVVSRIPIVLRSHWLAPGTSIGELESWLRERIAEAPGGRDQLAAVDRRNRILVHARLGTPKMTILFGLAILVVHVLQRMAERHFLAETYLEMGGTAWWLMTDGGWYRVLTGHLLHVDYVHLTFNLGMLLAIGPLLEGLIGPHRLWLVAIAGALAGSAVSVLWVDLITVGFSDSLYAMLGVLLVLNLLRRRALPAPHKVPLLLLVAYPIVDHALNQTMPTVNAVAHWAGLLAGIGVGLAMLPRLDLDPAVRTTPRGLRATANLLGVVCIVAIGQAAQFWVHADARVMAQLIARSLDDPELPPSAGIMLASYYMKADAPTPSELALARDVARRFALSQPERLELVDFMAELEYPMRATAAPVPIEVEVRDGGADGPVLRLGFDAGHPISGTAFVLVEAPGALRGLLRAIVVPSREIASAHDGDTLWIDRPIEASLAASLRGAALRVVYFHPQDYSGKQPGVYLYLSSTAEGPRDH